MSQYSITGRKPMKESILPGRKKIIISVIILLLPLLLWGCGSREETTPDTIRWFNASYAILTEANGWDYNTFGGMDAENENALQMQNLLRKWWDVTDRASADNVLNWLLKEGHRYEFIDVMKYYENYGAGEVSAEQRPDFLYENFEMPKEDADSLAHIYQIYDEYGPEAIDAWDYCRALNLMSYYYIAGYYTREEALDGSLEIAKILQSRFDSWDEMVDSYLRGYEYWAEESSDQRRNIYKALLEKEDNPYSVDWNTTLEKSWNTEKE